MNRLPISVCMVSGAEAHRIRASLDSVKDWVSEIVVVLNEEVSDGTDAILAEYGARVYREPWRGFLTQKNSVTDRASQAWILGLDADEVVSDALREEIISAVQSDGYSGKYNGFNFPRLTLFAGRWIRHGDWYPDRQLRLWRRGSGRWVGMDPHPYPGVDGRVRKLRGDLLHYSNESINKYVSKVVPYSDAFLENCIRSGRKARVIDLGFRPFHRFFRGYILKLGFLDGWQGYFIAWVNSFSAALRYTKVFDYHRDKNDENEKQSNP